MNEKVQWTHSASLSSVKIDNDTVVITEEYNKKYYLPLEKYGWNQITYFDYNHLLNDFDSEAVLKENLGNIL